jgi:hypothetical protein
VLSTRNRAADLPRVDRQPALQFRIAVAARLGEDQVQAVPARQFYHLRVSLPSAYAFS